MEPIGHFLPVIEIQEEENQIRQGLLEDLQDLELLLQQQRMTDVLSVNLRSWVVHFIHILNLKNPVDRVVDRMISLVYQMLQNPFGSFWPYDEQVFLGNDGYCYSKKALSVHLTCCEDEYLQHSPIAPNDPAPFFLVSPHHSAYAVQNWLIAHGIELQPSEVDRLYSQLESQGRLVAIPLGKPAVRPGGPEDLFERRRQRLLARQQQREQAQALLPIENELAAIEREAEANFRKTTERMMAFFQHIQAHQAELGNAGLAFQNNVGQLREQKQQVADRIQRLQEQILNEGFAGREERFNVEQFQRQDNMEQELRLFQEALQAAIAEGNVNNVEILQMGERVNGYVQRMTDMRGRANEQMQFLQTDIIDIHVANLEVQIQKIDEQNIALDSRLNNLGQGIQATKYQQATIEIGINNLDRVTKKMQQSVWKSIGMCVLQLGCYWAGSYALSSLVKGMTVMPSAKYGPMISYHTKL